MNDINDRVVLDASGPGEVAGRRDRLVHERVLGGPEAPLDVRLILSARELSDLLAVANASLTGRVVIGRAGIRLRVWQGEAGHRYETWSLLGASVEPERSPFLRSKGSR
jgi:hypothetical protein